MKRYRIERTAGPVRVTVLVDGRKNLGYLLPEVKTGMGRGFEFGYGGTGPACLAAAIVADLFHEAPTQDQWSSGRCRAWLHHQPVKWQFVAALNHDHHAHELDGEEILAFCREREEPCEDCGGSGLDQPGWCSTCGAVKGAPCLTQGEDGEDIVHAYAPAACGACCGLTVRLRQAVAT